jgi:hypothetical protein
MYVVDGETLIHRVRWAKKIYKNVIQQFVSYVCARYGTCCIVFDGYGQGSSIKDHYYLRRVWKTSADIWLSLSIEAHNNQQMFFSIAKQ